jgi:hypothetical protein
MSFTAEDIKAMEKASEAASSVSPSISPLFYTGGLVKSKSERTRGSAIFRYA